MPNVGTSIARNAQKLSRQYFERALKIHMPFKMLHLSVTAVFSKSYLNPHLPLMDVNSLGNIFKNIYNRCHLHKRFGKVHTNESIVGFNTVNYTFPHQFIRMLLFHGTSCTKQVTRSEGFTV